MKKALSTIIAGCFCFWIGISGASADETDVILYQIYQNNEFLGSVRPIATPQTAAQYYDYHSPSGYPAFGPEERKSLTWLHQDASNGDISLGLIHNKHGAGDNSNRMTMELDGLPDTAYLTVRDDTNDTYALNPPTATFNWSFGRRTDGTVISGLEGLWEMTIVPSGIQNISSWAFVSGSDGLGRIELDLSTPLVIKAVAEEPFWGECLQLPPNFNILIEQGNEQLNTLRTSNTCDMPVSAVLEMINPHPSLSISLQNQDELTIPSSATEVLILQTDATHSVPGLYDDILLKIALDNGQTLYSTISVTVADVSQGPDLTIRSDDIDYSIVNNDSEAILSATVKNSGNATASDVSVHFYRFDLLVEEVLIEEVPSGGEAIAAVTIPIEGSSGEHLIQVVIDPDNTIAELSEVNNMASKVISWGEIGPLEGGILVTGSLPSRVYPRDLFTLSGHAVYDITVGGIRYTNYVVKGGEVHMIISDGDGHEWIYGGIHTDINGNFTKRLQAPAELGPYRVFMTVIDKTLIGPPRELVFQVVERPETIEPPPFPPIVSGSDPGIWVCGLTKCVWEPGPDWPPDHPQGDLWIYSEDLYFSNPHPEAYQEITLFAQLHYWAPDTELKAENVPVNFYVTYPGTPREPIGHIVIPSLSVGEPDFGSRYVYATWKNRGEGIYIVEVVIDPDYIEAKMQNNAATRAIIVGNLPGTHGAIQGQVTGDWGGVADVILELYETGNPTLFSSTLTDDTGHYLFASIPAGEYQVRIISPSGFQPDAESKGIQVVAQEIGVVDFYLSEADPNQVDSDEDGYTPAQGDCDDTDANIHPDAIEVCDGVDNDCDGFVDEGVTATFYKDSDEDGFGNAAIPIQACEAPVGYAANGDDCDDSNISVNPDAVELCNEIDDNCNGMADEPYLTLYTDGDGDGYGTAPTVQACAIEPGLSELSGDCDDDNAGIHPGAEEIPNNGIDEDCDGEDLSFCGDLDHDGDVDSDDRNRLRGAFRTAEGDAGFISEADYDGDGDIDYSDYQIWYACYQAYIGQ